jgi:hypothetical protein
MLEKSKMQAEIMRLLFKDSHRQKMSAKWNVKVSGKVSHGQCIILVTGPEGHAHNSALFLGASGSRTASSGLVAWVHETGAQLTQEVILRNSGQVSEDG